MNPCSNQHTDRVESRKRDRKTESFQLARDMSVICDCVYKDDVKKQALDFDIICILIFDVFHFTQPFMAYGCVSAVVHRIQDIEKRK